MPVKKEKIVLRATGRQKQQLQKLADRADMTMSEYVRWLINRIVNNEGILAELQKEIEEEIRKQDENLEK